MEMSVFGFSELNKVRCRFVNNGPKVSEKVNGPILFKFALSLNFRPQSGFENFFKIDPPSPIWPRKKNIFCVIVKLF